MGDLQFRRGVTCISMLQLIPQGANIEQERDQIFESAWLTDERW